VTLTTFEPSAPTLWERRLHTLAYEDVEPYPRRDESSIGAEADAETLQQAYAYCDALTAKHSKTFYTASSLMPADKRRAVRALYAFCRISDDLVDCADPRASTAERLTELQTWRRRALLDPPSADDLPVLAWADTMARHHIPVRYAHQLLDGVAKDIEKTRYADFDELAEYCYGVASTVGLMSMHIAGFDTPAQAGVPTDARASHLATHAIPYAVKLGVALQLTNILRDVGEDWRNGRVYLPQDELAAYGLTEADFGGSQAVDGRWRALLSFQIARTRRLYAEALPGVDLLHRDGRFAIAAAAELYRGILEDIEAHDYQVFDRRAHLTKWGKLHRLPGIWWRARRGYGKEGQ
jgi:phytoene synthase